MKVLHLGGHRVTIALDGPSALEVVSIDRPGVSVEAVKWADRSDAVVVRLCEVWGSRGPVRITLHRPFVSVAQIPQNVWV